VLSTLLLSLMLLPLRQQTAIRPDADPHIEQLVASISEKRLQQIDEKLTGFVTRNTLSDTTSADHGIGAARQWIFDELKLLLAPGDLAIQPALGQLPVVANGAFRDSQNEGGVDFAQAAKES
jgi:hypothetical protein